VKYDKEKEKLTILINSKEITLKYPNVNNIIQIEITSINVKDSFYIIH
jgi:hypothetical protein